MFERHEHGVSFVLDRGFEGEHDRLLLLSGMLSRASTLQLQRRLEEFAAEFDRLMAQDAALPAAQREGLSLVLAQRPWSLSLFAELRRSVEGAPPVS